MTQVKELKAQSLNTESFIEEKVKEISSTVGQGVAINALSGGVDSSAVTLLGHKALGDKLKTYFVENGLMRKHTTSGCSNSITRSMIYPRLSKLG